MESNALLVTPLLFTVSFRSV